MRKPDCFEQNALAGKPIDNCLVIDAHGHIGPMAGIVPAFSLYDSSIEATIEVMDRIGIDLFCASAYLGIAGYAEEGNNVLLDAVRQLPDRIFGYMMANINCKNLTAELERCLNAGLRGIKIHSQAGYPYKHSNYTALFEFANANALPILAHTWGTEVHHLEPLFNKYQQINFILAHAGSVEKENYARVANDYENVYLETCFSQCPRGLIEYFVSECSADNVLWGSDMSFMSAEHQVGRVLFADISEADKAKLLGQTAQRVLNIKDSEKEG